MASHQAVTNRITEAQEAINVEIKNVAAALGLPAPKLNQPYVAAQYEQIAVHLESVASALAKLNQKAAARATDDAEAEADDADDAPTTPSEESITPEQPAPTTSTRRGKATAAQAESEA